MAPVDEVIQLMRAIPEYPSVDAQDEFCRHIVHSSYAHVPPSKRWMKSLLKRMEKDLCNAEMSDDLTELFLTFLTSQEYADDTEFCDEAFITFIPVHESDESGGNSTLTTTIRVLRLHNEVGTRIWEAGLYLAEILYGYPSLLTGKVVVELGAGSGATLLLVVKNCCSSEREIYLPSTALLTDNMPTVLENLKYNVELNATGRVLLPQGNSPSDMPYIYSAKRDVDDATTTAGAALQCLVSVQHLDFETATVEQSRRLQADVILVADCTYSEDIHAPLVGVLEKLLCIPTSQFMSSCSSTSNNTSSSNNSNSNSNYSNPIEVLMRRAAAGDRPVCLLAATIRNPPTYAHFIDTLNANNNLQWDDVTDFSKTLAGEQRYRYDYRDSIRILLITARES